MSVIDHSLRTAAPREPGTFTSVVDRVAAHAAGAPERVAITDDTTEITYAQLDDQAERLAAALRVAGAEAGSCVGVFLSRSARYVIAIQAVLKTGAAYLPLDPTTPTQRIEYILADAGASIVVTDGRRSADVPDGPWTTFDLDLHREDSPIPPAKESSAEDLSGESLAYVIYTSGSTGRPKGVEITHANLASLVDWHDTAFGIVPDDRASQVAGLGFDAAGWEIWPHLAAGASVHVADDHTHRSAQLLRDWLVEREITVCFAPTLLAEQLIQIDWPENTALRTLLTGAERLNRRPPPGLPFTFVNNYGPTECTVVSTSGVVTPNVDHAEPPSIGSPLPGTLGLVLDEDLEPVPDGEPGELVIAGPHVGRGYRHDPAKTASRFVTVRTDDGGTARAYRTGDRVRRLDDGRLAFLGRLDEQVKLRGHRIEPAEIVTWLVQCPGVSTGAVVLDDDSADPAAAEGDRELVAYIVPGTDPPPTPADVRAFLSAQLPEYMVPAHVIVVPSLPTTPNGKLDTAALPRPGTPAEVTDDTEEQADADAIQGWLSSLVAELLKLPEVDVDDNIFLLGGHSMLAMQVVSRIRQRYQVDLKLRQLFNAPTVAAMSAEVVRLREAKA